MLLMVQKNCMSCKDSHSVNVDSEDLKYYTENRDVLVQNVWPELTPDQREILISWDREGPFLCPTCWDKFE